MANILKGIKASEAINTNTLEIIDTLNSHNITPTLATIRIGEGKDDITYEKSLIKKCNELNITILTNVLNIDCKDNDVLDLIEKLNNDISIHGILLFKPLPKHLNVELIRNAISFNKDIDGSTDYSFNNISLNSIYIPCTAKAVIELLHSYDIEIHNKNITIIGRSLTVGKPLEILLKQLGANVSVCHSQTTNIKFYTLNSDIVISAIGKANYFDETYFNKNSTIIDVGISYDTKLNKLCGDIQYDKVENIVKNITPRLNGVGIITTSILLNNLVKSALKNI